VNEVEVASAGIEDPPWRQRCRRFAEKVLEVRRIDGWELSILLTGDETIRNLNRRYRSLDAPTDVLSFSQSDNIRTSTPEELHPAGDIVISIQTMARNAQQRAIPQDEELKRLLIHGILHLEGMDHEDEESEMIRLQESILARLKQERMF